MLFASKVSQLGDAHTSKGPLGGSERAEQRRDRNPSQDHLLYATGTHVGSLQMAQPPRGAEGREHTALTPNPERLPLVPHFPLGFLCTEQKTPVCWLPSKEGTRHSETSMARDAIASCRGWNRVPGASAPTNSSFSYKHATRLKGAHLGDRLKRKLTPVPPAPHRRGVRTWTEGKPFTCSSSALLLACSLIKGLASRQLVAIFRWAFWPVISQSMPTLPASRQQEQPEALADSPGLFIYEKKWLHQTGVVSQRRPGVLGL